MEKKNEQIISIKCKGSWRQIRVSFGTIRPITCAKIKMLCAEKSFMNSIECFNQISEQDQTPLSTNRTAKIYHRENFLKSIS
jgi:hypothetical protein